MSLAAVYAIASCIVVLLISIKGGRYTLGTGPYLSSAIMNMSVDVIIVVLPIPMPVLWELQMQMSKKMALTAIFGKGVL